MICRLTGRVDHVNEHAVVLDVGSVCYEVLTPAAALAELRRATGESVTLHTIQYIDGGPGMGQMAPRMLGFLTETDRAFFLEFVKVKHVGMRKALRSMTLPVHQLAAAIEAGDERLLAGLPEIGKRTAAQIVAQLRGRLARFITGQEPQTPTADMNPAQRLALEVLVAWGDRPADAQRWLTRVMETHPELTEPDQLVTAAYRVKQGLSG